MLFYVWSEQFYWVFCLSSRPGWVDHWWYLIGRHKLPNDYFNGYFHGTGAQIAQTDWHP